MNIIYIIYFILYVIARVCITFASTLPAPPGDNLIAASVRRSLQLLNNGDLLIKNLETDDFGDYVCEASNGLSRSSITTNVYVYA